MPCNFSASRAQTPLHRVLSPTVETGVQTAQNRAPGAGRQQMARGGFGQGQQRGRGGAPLHQQGNRGGGFGSQRQQGYQNQQHNYNQAQRGSGSKCFFLPDVIDIVYESILLF